MTALTEGSRGREHAVQVGLLDQHPARLRALVAGDDRRAARACRSAGRPGCSRPAGAAGSSETEAVCVCTTISIALSSSGSSSGSKSPVVARPRRPRRAPRAARAATRRAPARAGARHCSTTSAISSSVTYAPWTRCSREVPSGLKSMSPWPSRLSAPAPSRITRESVWLETANAIRHGTFALIIPVITSTDGPLRGEDEVDADRARLLREADHGVLDRLRRDHHQVGELVDHDEQVRERLLPARAERAVRLGQVACADLREPLVPPLHLGDDVGEHGASPPSGSRRPGSAGAGSTRSS